MRQERKQLQVRVLQMERHRQWRHAAIFINKFQPALPRQSETRTKVLRAIVDL